MKASTRRRAGPARALGFALLVVVLMLPGSLRASPTQALASVTATAVDGGQWQRDPATEHYYKQVDGLTWVEAEAHAVTLGGHLVTINDQAEQDWLATTFTDTELWIGMNDRAVEGTWVWSSGEPVTYENWFPGQPNEYVSQPPGDPFQGEDAAVMRGGPGGALGWNDLPENGRLGAVVEVTSLAPHAATLVVRAELAALLPSGDKKLDDQLGKAVQHIDKSLDSLVVDRRFDARPEARREGLRRAPEGGRGAREDQESSVDRDGRNRLARRNRPAARADRDRPGGRRRPEGARQGERRAGQGRRRAREGTQRGRRSTTTARRGSVLGKRRRTRPARRSSRSAPATPPS